MKDQHKHKFQFNKKLQNLKLNFINRVKWHINNNNANLKLHTVLNYLDSILNSQMIEFYKYINKKLKQENWIQLIYN